jgi:hypothetical protein
MKRWPGALLLGAALVAHAAAASPQDDAHARPRPAASTAAESSSRPAHAAQSSPPGTRFTFVIPRNTCQQDTPLHVFLAQPARSSASAPRSQGVAR